MTQNYTIYMTTEIKFVGQLVKWAFVYHYWKISYITYLNITLVHFCG